MSQEFRHDPVLLDTIVELFDPVPQGVVIDATVGGGGHAAALLARRDDLSVIGIDRDPIALQAAAERLARFGARASLRRARFDQIASILGELSVTGGPISGALFDLGVSSPQLDEAARGFSYSFDGPLDMRMDPDAPGSAAEIVNEAAADDLARLFAEHGEARFAARIAHAIVTARPIGSTAELAEIVARSVPVAARRRGHPARRVFQALRVAVNEELEQLPVALDAAIEGLVAGGRIVVLSYHSGEDRIVKERFRDGVTGGCVCPPHLPCVCGAVPTLRLVRTPKRASADEVARNPRAESARLRVAERIVAEAA